MMEPLLFKPFQKLKETFCRQEWPLGQYFQKAITISPLTDSEIEIAVADERGTGVGGVNEHSFSTSVRLSPKQVIVLRNLLAKVEIAENPQFHVTEKKVEKQ